jgi:biotin-dependent carboxylase-like uncharacterized protein
MATIQDLGRAGFRHLGVTESGALDRHSLRLANRLVGNPEGAAAIEITFGGLVLRFGTATVVSLAGAPCPADLDGRQVSMYSPISVASGATLRLDAPSAGLRTYVAVRGGIDAVPVLGSRSTDTLSGLGPAPLAPGTVLDIGAPSLSQPRVDIAPQANYPAVFELRVLVGPRDDWFPPESLRTLLDTPYAVTTSTNRVGMRLAGPALHRSTDQELKPEGMVRGALQVPPDGQPILFLADHPVTGGYPVIAVVVDSDIDLAAQARPGAQLRFTAVRRVRSS